MSLNKNAFNKKVTKLPKEEIKKTNSTVINTK